MSDNNETILTVLRHCTREECFGCPYRQTRGCTRKMAFTAKQYIDHLLKCNAELEAHPGLMWRKASDPPEESGRYLCIVNCGVRNPKYRLDTVRYDAEFKVFRVSAIVHEVLYWAPTPETPEGIILYEEEKVQ